MNGVGEPIDFDEAFDERTAEIEPDFFPRGLPVGMVFMMGIWMNQIDVSRVDFAGIALEPEVTLSGDDVFEHGKVFAFAADAVAAVGVRDSGGLSKSAGGRTKIVSFVAGINKKGFRSREATESREFFFSEKLNSELSGRTVFTRTETAVAGAVEASRAVAEGALRTLCALASLVDAESSSAEFAAVKSLDCTGRAVVIHFDEAEAFRTVCLSVDYEFDAGDFSMLGKKIADFVFGCAVRQIAYINTLHDTFASPF